VFTVGVQNFREYSPYSEYKNKEYKGFNRELLDMFASSQGYNFKYKARPLRRLYAEYLAGAFDFKYPDNPLWQKNLKQQADIKYSNAVVRYTDGLMLLPANKDLTFNKLKSISMLKGFTPPKEYLQREQQGTLQIVRTSTYQHLLQLVLKKRVDAGYFNVDICREYLISKGRDADALFFAGHLPFVQSFRTLSSIQQSEIIKAFNRFLVENKSAVAQLKDKYGLTEK